MPIISLEVFPLDLGSYSYYTGSCKSRNKLHDYMNLKVGWPAGYFWFAGLSIKKNLQSDVNTCDYYVENFCMVFIEFWYYEIFLVTY